MDQGVVERSAFTSRRDSTGISWGGNKERAGTEGGNPPVTEQRKSSHGLPITSCSAKALAQL